MRIIILRDWRNCITGREMEVPDGMANELIRRGIAKRAVSVECMAVNNKGCNAMLNRTPKKRG